MMDWNVVVTVRHDYGRAIGLLRSLGAVERTGLYNVIRMRVPDVHALLDQLVQLPPEGRFFDTISHVVPVTHKVAFTTADELERNVMEIARRWLPQLAGKSLHVRVRRRGHKGQIHGLDLERQIGGALLDALAERGTPGRIELDDPDAVIAIELIRDEAGLALWTRAELAQYPFLRASIERGAARRPPPVAAESAPSRAMLAATSSTRPRLRGDHRATREEIAELLGDLGRLTVDQLLATGATIGEIAEAISAIEDEDAFGEMHHPPSTPREAEVRAILEDLVFENFEEQASEREIART